MFGGFGGLGHVVTDTCSSMGRSAQKLRNLVARAQNLQQQRYVGLEAPHVTHRQDLAPATQRGSQSFFFLFFTFYYFIPHIRILAAL